MATIDEWFAVHEAMAELTENCREILDRFFARDESYTRWVHARHPVGHDHHQDLPLPGTAARDLRGKKSGPRCVELTETR